MKKKITHTSLILLMEPGEKEKQTEAQLATFVHCCALLGEEVATRARQLEELAYEARDDPLRDGLAMMSHAFVFGQLMTWAGQVSRVAARFMKNVYHIDDATDVAQIPWFAGHADMKLGKITSEPLRNAMNDSLIAVEPSADALFAMFLSSLMTSSKTKD